jgi:uncharacterized protein YjbI with pentapeptide repeats
MSDSNGTCEYVLDPEDPETWGGEEGDECYVDEEVLNEDGVWTCPHDAEESEELCIFHLPVKRKNDKEVAKRLLQEIDQAVDIEAGETEKHRLQFLCSKFGDFDISKESEYMESTYIFAPEQKIDLSYADFNGEVDFSGVSFNTSHVILNGIYFQDVVDFSRSEFEGIMHFTGAEFQSKTYFKDSVFHKSVTFRRTLFDSVTFSSVEFRQDADFHKAIFSSQTVFVSSSFKESVDFSDVIFKYDDEFSDSKIKEEGVIGQRTFEMIDFYDASFNKSANFMRTEFRNVTQMNNIECGGSINFSYSEFQKGVRFYNSYFPPDSEFKGVEFKSEVGFIESEFYSVILTDAVFYNGVDARDSKFINTDFSNANLSGGNFSDSKICECDFESAILSRTILFNADLRGAKLNGAILGDARINEDTQFLGNPDDDSDSSPHTLSAIRSKPCCVYDPKYEEDNDEADVEKAKSVYRALEELAGKTARTRLQSQCFVRRQDLQKDDYRRDAKEADSWQERLIAGARYSLAKLSQKTLLYGESPWRIIAWSLATSFAFTFLYPLGGWVKPVEGEPITYGTIAENLWLLGEVLYYSTLTFTTLGLGDYRPVEAGRYLTTLNTALGAVLIALLVFVLGRRAAR